MPFEVESDLEALDYDEKDEENVADDINEDNDTPPKVDKVAFRMAYDAIPDSSKLRLSGGTPIGSFVNSFHSSLSNNASISLSLNQSSYWLLINGASTFSYRLQSVRVAIWIHSCS